MELFWEIEILDEMNEKISKGELELTEDLSRVLCALWAIRAKNAEADRRDRQRTEKINHLKMEAHTASEKLRDAERENNYLRRMMEHKEGVYRRHVGIWRAKAKRLEAAA